MRDFRARAGAVWVALMLTGSLTACQKMANTSGNPEVGEMTGAVVGRSEVRMDGVSPDTTQVATPGGEHSRQVMTVPEANLNLNHDEFMQSCAKSCNPDNDKAAMHQKFCREYCHCSFQNMDKRVPIADLRAFARNEQNQSTRLISSIIRQCQAFGRNELKDRDPVSVRQVPEQNTGGYSQQR